MTEEISKAASLYRIGRYRDLGIEPEYVWSDIDAAFEAGAAWQKERDNLRPAFQEGYEAAEMASNLGFQSEIRDTLDKLAEGVAFMLRQQQDLAGMGLRGADRGVAILKHLQEIGDNVRGVSSAIGDKFGVVLDAVKDVGEKVEACMAIANNTEEGLAVAIDKLDKLGVEKWREAIKYVEADARDYEERTKDPISRMHAAVRDLPDSGLGKLWADLPTKLEEVSDQTLRELAVSGQISEARYFEEYMRRHGDDL